MAPASERAVFLMDWTEIAKAEPRLLDLYKEAAAIRDDKRKPSFCANAVWYGYGGHRGLKPRLIYLVGWARRPDESGSLGSADAYDVAYQTIYDQLPDCRNCSCA